MKLATKIIASTAALGFLTMTAGGLQAQQATNLVTLTATALVQGTTNNNGTVTTTKAPTQVTLNTKQILAFLATAEHFPKPITIRTLFPPGPSWW